jgi:hypothetical protein
MEVVLLKSVPFRGAKTVYRWIDVKLVESCLDRRKKCVV